MFSMLETFNPLFLTKCSSGNRKILCSINKNNKIDQLQYFLCKSTENIQFYKILSLISIFTKPASTNASSWVVLVMIQGQNNGSLVNGRLT